MKKLISKNLREFINQTERTPQEMQTKLNISKTTYYDYLKNGVDSLQFVYDFGEIFRYDLLSGKFFAQGNVSCIHNDTPIKDSGVALKSGKNFIVYDKNAKILSKYGPYLESEGYELRFLNLIDLNKSNTYNPMQRLNVDDENELHYICDEILSNIPHNQGHKTMLEALILYLLYYRPKHQQTLNSITKLLRATDRDDANKSKLDKMFEEVFFKDPNSYALKRKNSVSEKNQEELKDILSFLTSEVLINLTDISGENITDTICMEDILNKKIAYFVLYDNNNMYEWIMNIFSLQFAKIIKCSDNIAVLNAPKDVQEIYQNILSVQNGYDIKLDIKQERKNREMERQKEYESFQKEGFIAFIRQTEEERKHIVNFKEKISKIITKNKENDKIIQCLIDIGALLNDKVYIIDGGSDILEQITDINKDITVYHPNSNVIKNCNCLIKIPNDIKEDVKENIVDYLHIEDFLTIELNDGLYYCVGKIPDFVWDEI